MKVGLHFLMTESYISKRGTAFKIILLWKTDSSYMEFWQHKRDYCHILKATLLPES